MTRRHPYGLASVALLMAAGCFGPLEPTVTAWEARLLPTDGRPGPTASLGATADRIRTYASLLIEDGEPGGELQWHLAAGSCQDPGPVVGGSASYPEITLDAGGGAEVEATLSDELSPTGLYHAALLESATGERVACGDLRRRN